MLRQMLKNANINLTDEEFKEILKITTDDIRENRIKFGKMTSLQEVFNVAVRTYKVMKKAKEVSRC